MSDIKQLQDFTTQVRRDILRMVHAVNSGHPGGSLGCTEFLVALYQNILTRKEGFDMDGIGEDLFFLSNGHISPVFYSVLARSGYFPVAELATFRKLNTRLQGHPTTHEGLPGIRIASGSLGQGLSVAIGAAQAKKLNNYQIILFTWAATLSLGYFISVITFKNIVPFFTIWAILITIALVVQLKLGGFGDKKIKLIQALWLLVIVLPGFVFNYFEYQGLAPLIGNGFAGWPATCAVAMVIIAVIYKFNLSYFLLAGLYAFLALLVFMVSGTTTLLIISGLGFGIICSIDAMLENTKLRKGLATKLKSN